MSLQIVHGNVQRPGWSTNPPSGIQTHCLGYKPPSGIQTHRLLITNMILCRLSTHGCHAEPVWTCDKRFLAFCPQLSFFPPLCKLPPMTNKTHRHYQYRYLIISITNIHYHQLSGTKPGICANVLTPANSFEISYQASLQNTYRQYKSHPAIHWSHRRPCPAVNEPAISK